MTRLKYIFPIALLMVVLGGSISACGSVEEAGIAESEPVALTQSVDEPASEAVDNITGDDAGAVLPEEAPPNYCLECHSDQQTLTDVADPVEEVESENEGEG